MRHPFEVATVITLGPHQETTDRHQEDTMISRITTGVAGTPLTRTERAALQSLRASYQSGQHLFTERELAHLRFLRWLVQSPAWNQAMDRADEHETIVGAVHEKPGSTQAMPEWTLGLLG
jgi:hypothetical protein